jgi:hypothetical protein
MTPSSPPPSIARCSAPSRSYVLASLRALHLDRACAPAVSWQLRRTSHHQDQLYAGLHTSRGSPLEVVLGEVPVDVAGEQRGRGGKISADQARALCGRSGCAVGSAGMVEKA